MLLLLLLTSNEPQYQPHIVYVISASFLSLHAKIYNELENFYFSNLITNVYNSSQIVHYLKFMKGC